MQYLQVAPRLCRARAEHLLVTQRLTKEGTKDVPQVLGPSLLAPDTTETYYLFQHAGHGAIYDGEDERFDITIQKSFALHESCPKLTLEKNLWPGHSRTCLQGMLKGEEGMACLHKALTATAPDMQEFIASYVGSTRGKRKAMTGGTASVSIAENEGGEEHVVNEAMSADLTDAIVTQQHKERQAESPAALKRAKPFWDYCCRECGGWR